MKIIPNFIFISTILFAHVAFAQGPDIQHFRPSLPHQMLLQTFGSETMLKPYAFSLMANYVDQPLEFTTTSGQDNLINGILTYDLGASFFLTRSATLGLSTSFAPLISPNSSLSNLVKDRALGDTHLSLLYNIVSKDKQKVGFSILPEIYFPTGNESDFMGHPGYGFSLKVIADIQNGPWYSSVNLGMIKRLD